MEEQKKETPYSSLAAERITAAQVAIAEVNAEAAARLNALLAEVRDVCKVTGPVPLEDLNGIVEEPKRRRKAKASKKAAGRKAKVGLPSEEPAAPTTS